MIVDGVVCLLKIKHKNNTEKNVEVCWVHLNIFSIFLTPPFHISSCSKFFLGDEDKSLMSTCADPVTCTLANSRRQVDSWIRTHDKFKIRFV